MSSSLNLEVCVLSQALTPAQKLAIRNALTKIKVQEKINNIQFWGKIQGTQQDYFIAVATDITNTIQKKFYWSNDEGATFAHLPSPDEFVSHKSSLIRGLFTGNPTKKLKDPEAPPKRDEDGEIIEEEDEEEEEEEEEEQPEEDEVDEDGNPIERPPPPRRLTELERLSFNVHQIDAETCLVPRGSYYMTALGSIHKNHAFEGLSLEDARKLTNFQLLRNPTNPATLAAIRKAGLTNHHDFLDNIAPHNQKVKHTWSLHVSESGLDVSLRSLLYPGFEYKLEAGTNNYTGGYFGLGEKNADLLFML